jgi:hypothetical protein
MIELFGAAFSERLTALVQHPFAWSVVFGAIGMWLMRPGGGA